MIEPIPNAEGGGYMVTFPALPGCITDGETLEEALQPALDAFEAWSAAELEDKGLLPKPKTYSGLFVQCIPKSLHRKLARRAEIKSVSLSQLSATFLAAGVAEN
ncbi:MAG: type II toxin-antitoxin system HicB family antitoxin [Pseudomonadales bacterium]|nr:type II toxin-antitoxin system HicB family antitoxin [Pseudomonadales bacterium]